jgi:SAM-dependent methyltransferase
MSRVSTVGTEAPVGSHLQQPCCLICGSPRSRVLFTGTEERFSLGGAFSVLSCQRCGFRWTALDDGIDLNDWYERGYWRDVGENGSGTGRASTSWQAVGRRLWRAVAGSVRPSRWLWEGRVLDVGCGPGHDTREMQELGAHVVGIDISRTALRQAARSRLPVVRATPHAFPFAEGAFDAVVMSQVVEHLPAPAEALGGARRVLRSGGRLLVMVPNAAGVQRYVFGSHWVIWHLPYHLWHFDASSVAALLRRSGFRVEKVRTYSPGEWFLLSLGLRWPLLRRIGANRAASRLFRLVAAPVLRLSDVFGLGDCLVVEARKL